MNYRLKISGHAPGGNSKGFPLRVTLAFVLLMGLAGCGSTTTTGTGASGPVMPDVVGEKLDVALSDIKRAGIEDEVEVLGGGTFGVVVKSNWQVCEQLPAPGQAITAAPRLTVDRTCDGGVVDSTPQSAAPPDTQPAPTTQPITAPTPAPTTQPITAPTPAPVEEILTAKNNTFLAAILTVRSECDDSIGLFALQYAGRVIEFDGNVAFKDSYSDDKTQLTYLLGVDDYREKDLYGPLFQFKNVRLAELNLIGPVIPRSVDLGDNLHIVAKVVGYKAVSCLFFLQPISTEVR